MILFPDKKWLTSWINKNEKKTYDIKIKLLFFLNIKFRFLNFINSFDKKIKIRKTIEDLKNITKFLYVGLSKKFKVFSKFVSIVSHMDIKNVK